jgi:hypothetical protein
MLTIPLFDFDTKSRECYPLHTGRIVGVELTGNYIRLEPLDRRHADGLVAAAAADPSLYRWTFAPRSVNEAIHYIDTALAWRDAGTAVPFAIIRLSDAVVVGSTRFWNLEQWSWPTGYQRHGRNVPDVCEIGHT